MGNVNFPQRGFASGRGLGNKWEGVGFGEGKNAGVQTEEGKNQIAVKTRGGATNAGGTIEGPIIGGGGAGKGDSFISEEAEEKEQDFVFKKVPGEKTGVESGKEEKTQYHRRTQREKS